MLITVFATHSQLIHSNPHELDYDQEEFSEKRKKEIVD